MKRHSARLVSYALMAGLVLASAPALAQTGDDDETNDDPATQPTGKGASGKTLNVTVAGKGKKSQEDHEEAEDGSIPTAPKSRPFAGTQVFVQALNANTNTFFGGQQQTRNSTVSSAMFLQPRYRLSKDFQVRARWIISREWTDNDVQTQQGETRTSDLTAQLWYDSLPHFAGFMPKVAFTLQAPASKESFARTMYAGPGALLQLLRPFQNVLGGDAFVLATASYSHFFYRYTTPGLVNEPAYAPQCFSDASCTGQGSGLANVSDSLSWALIAGQQWGDFSPAAFFLMRHDFPHQFQDLSGVTRVEDGATVRNSTFFSAWLDYNVNPWMTTELGYNMSRPLQNADSTYGNPIYARYQSTTVYLGFNVNIDTLVETLEGGSAEGGIIRAKNDKPKNRGPIVFF